MSPPQSAATAVEDQKPGTETVAPAATAASAPPTEAAKLVPATSASLNRCAARLRSGSLVAFPTETVYGLGCHALDPNAVAKIFEAKERPRTDPLIVHVTKAEDALDLWSGCAEDGGAGGGRNSAEAQVLQSLTTKFFPGPLTLVAKARTSVPPIVTAGTGFVACRSPSHPIARTLIGAAGIPIAAPSANKFGHVSPTRAQHVYDDLGKEDVWIVDPTLGGEGDAEEEGGAVATTTTQHVCDVGVESTVAKLEMSSPSSGTVTVLRHGAVSASDMRQCIEHSGLADRFTVKSVIQSTKENVATVAPGQTVRHYSPDVVSYLIAHGRYSSKLEVTQEEKDLLSHAVVVDFGGRLSALEQHALAYRDLSSGGKSSEAASRVFETLRWSETVEGTERVYFPELLVTFDGKDRDNNNEEEEVDALILAVKDRLTRAASGVVIETLR